jgi:2-keto-4-pentenoate hydratase
MAGHDFPGPVAPRPPQSAREAAGNADAERAMNPEQAGELIFAEAQAGRWFPQALRGQLTLEQALRAQLGVRDRKLASGGKQGGWKIGLTSERVRKRYGTDARPFGHILAASVHSSGAVVPMAGFPHAAIEPELCFTIGETLRGPGVTPQQARAATAAVSAGFELNQNRAQGVTDFPLTVADNLSQWGIVVGDSLQPIPPDLDLARVKVVFRKGDQVVAETVGGPETIDDHFLSLSILANTLGEYGETLAAGMRVITGSFAKVDVAAGETWTAEFSGIGTVRVHFA